MRIPVRRARVATVCVLGRKATRQTMNQPRIRLMLRVIEEIVRRDEWHPVDAVVFPGCFFRLKDFIGRLDFHGRAESMERQDFGKAARAAANHLHSRCPGALIIAGADSGDPVGNENGDQLCVAFAQSGVVGIGRKIFPTDLDTRDCWWPITPDAKDFVAPERFIDLANGSRAVLCACYDLFGIGEDFARPSMRARWIRCLYASGQYREYGNPEFLGIRRRCISAWRHLVTREQPDVAIAAIHAFKLPGMDGYWQRHGIAAASAALSGGLSVGAAHFHQALPTGGHSSLGSAGVEARHLRCGLDRKAERLSPISSFVVTRRDAPTALVRLFSSDG